MSNRLDILATRRLIHIPGPNPIIKVGGAGEWDERSMEAGEILKDYQDNQESYYFYYHGRPQDTTKWPRDGYRIGVAVASQPLGPFSKSPQNPLLDLGPQGTWEETHVACPCIIKHGPDRYIMWYSGYSRSDQRPGWSIGVATASHPLGPWQKYEGNPILENCGYPGGVVLVNGTYYMYTAHPISAFAQDYSPLALYTATDPYGPWKPYLGNPVLHPGSWGAWDDGGYSEGKVTYHEACFHIFYGGAKEQTPRMRSLESIGYAISEDGYHFVKHADNPVVGREKSPDLAAMAETQALFEPPFIYLYHTLRYLSSERPDLEELGVQVLITSRPFKLAIPILQVDELVAGATSALTDCPPINLDHVNSLALTIRCTYHSKTRAGARVYTYASHDGLVYDTVAWEVFDQVFDKKLTDGQAVQRTVDLKPNPRYIKVTVENLDSRHDIHNLAVIATLGAD